MAYLNEFRTLKEQTELIKKCGINDLKGINIINLDSNSVYFSRYSKKNNYEDFLEGQIVDGTIVMKNRVIGIKYAEANDKLIEKKFLVYVGNSDKILLYRLPNEEKMNDYYTKAKNPNKIETQKELKYGQR